MPVFHPIGVVRTGVSPVPRHWTVSDAEGELVIDEQYREGLRDLLPGQRIVVLFHFHESPPFMPGHLVQKPPHKDIPQGVFSTCSPIRPNAIGMSVVEVLGVEGTAIRIKGLDMRDRTPVLDIKPLVDLGEGNSGKD
jgi:tRNA-Thr(GGU) m(6)t(6)A37 methyltransferase TsaA